MAEPSPKLKEAVEKTTRLIDELTDPSQMSQQEVRDFYDLLLDDVEVRYNQVCEDLGES
jgi:polyhydroxyalkanoate synthesis regulator phasin